MRILDGLGIDYEAAEYEDDGEHELARGAAGRMAEKLGVAPETVFKTIVMRTDTKEICVFCQSAVSEINLKKARNAAGCKEIAPVKPEELTYNTYESAKAIFGDSIRRTSNPYEQLSFDD